MERISDGSTKAVSAQRLPARNPVSRVDFTTASVGRSGPGAGHRGVFAPGGATWTTETRAPSSACPAP
jgi:hypothetical protein